jgi:hypothetical protein
MAATVWGDAGITEERAGKANRVFYVQAMALLSK